MRGLYITVTTLALIATALLWVVIQDDQELTTGHGTKCGPYTNTTPMSRAQLWEEDRSTLDDVITTLITCLEKGDLTTAQTDTIVSEAELFFEFTDLVMTFTVLKNKHIASDSNRTLIYELEYTHSKLADSVQKLKKTGLIEPDFNTYAYFDLKEIVK